MTLQIDIRTDRVSQYPRFFFKKRGDKNEICREYSVGVDVSFVSVVSWVMYVRWRAETVRKVERCVSSEGTLMVHHNLFITLLLGSKAKYSCIVSNKNE